MSISNFKKYYFPNEILNIIFSYREVHPLSKLIKNVYNYYLNDSNPYEITHKYHYSYNFQYWYFYIIRKEFNKTMELTPLYIPIGREKLKIRYKQINNKCNLNMKINILKNRKIKY